MILVTQNILPFFGICTIGAFVVGSLEFFKILPPQFCFLLSIAGGFATGWIFPLVRAA